MKTNAARILANGRPVPWRPFGLQVRKDEFRLRADKFGVDGTAAPIVFCGTMEAPVTKQSVVIPKNIDDLTKAELDVLFEESNHQLDILEARWAGLVKQTEQERTHSVGRSLGVLSAPLHLLFNLLMPKNGKESDLLKFFSGLGDADFGDDPEKFEPELLSRRLYRVEYEQKIQERFVKLARSFGDDALHTGEMVIGPGMMALALARTLALSSAAHRAVLAPVLDAFSALTKRARARSAEARAEKKASVDAEKKTADDKKPPTT
jgi:hypothetical protein